MTTRLIIVGTQSTISLTAAQDIGRGIASPGGGASRQPRADDTPTTHRPPTPQEDM